MKKPSVTQLIKLLDKPALFYWANKIGLQGISIKAHNKKSSADGTSIHSQIHNFMVDKKPLDDPNTQKRLQLFLSNKNVLATEKKIETPFFVGRYDLKLKEKGKTWMCDFKSFDGVYFETILQLVAYRSAEKTDGIAIIKVPEFTLIPIEVKSYAPYENILEALYIIYMNKQLLGI